MSVLYAYTIVGVNDGVQPSSNISSHQATARTADELRQAVKNGLAADAPNPLSLIVVQSGEMSDRHWHRLVREYPKLRDVPVVLVKYDRRAHFEYWNEQGLRVVALVPSHVGNHVVPQVGEHVLG